MLAGYLSRRTSSEQSFVEFVRQSSTENLHTLFETNEVKS
jgi:hypothetical protein